MRVLILLAATSAGLLAAPALAADIGEPEPLPAPPIVEAQPENNWTGFYLGALLGYTAGEGATDVGIDVDVDGLEGGGYAGANWQWGNFVLGAEGDILASGVEGSEAGLDLEQGLHGSLRARVGIALDRFLLYGTAGGAITELEAESPAGADDAALWGWTAGAGAEAMVLDNVTARVEYRYSDYEDETFTLGNTPVDTEFDTHSVRAGVGVKF